MIFLNKLSSLYDYGEAADTLLFNVSTFSIQSLFSKEQLINFLVKLVDNNEQVIICDSACQTVQELVPTTNDPFNSNNLNLVIKTKIYNNTFHLFSENEMIKNCIISIYLPPMTLSLIPPLTTEGHYWFVSFAEKPIYKLIEIE